MVNILLIIDGVLLIALLIFSLIKFGVSAQNDAQEGKTVQPVDYKNSLTAEEFANELAAARARLNQEAGKQVVAATEDDAAPVKVVETRYVQVPVEAPQPIIQYVTAPAPAQVYAQPVAPAPVPQAYAQPIEQPAPVAQPVVEEQPAPVAKAMPQEETLVIADIEDEEDDREVVRRIPFSEKMLAFDKKTQEYYDVLHNEFKSYRNINPRISAKGVSYRLGRVLVAKITLRGKTMKLHLALDFNEFEQNIYFQKDLSDVKTYVEVPFTVKVKSDRGLKNALKLVEALAEKKEIVKKTRYEKIDALQQLKDIVDSNSEEIGDEDEE